MKAKKYTYGRIAVIDYVIIVVMMIPALRFLYACGEWIAAVIQGDVSRSLQDWGVYLLTWIFNAVFFMAAAGPNLNMRQQFILTDEGIHVRMFKVWYFWKFIPWGNVKSFYPVSLPQLGIRMWILRVDEKLTIWHRLFARRYSPADESVILVSSNIRYWKSFKSRVKNYLAEKDELGEE